ncbi:MAG: hypothetical protein OEQ25_10825 [Gammaproteobacteria bacterium]|nr:hypothetical protein [Gammaproteobacteria bacterium]
MPEDGTALLSAWGSGGHRRAAARLRNLIERVPLFADGGVIDVEHLPAGCSNSTPEDSSPDIDELVTLDEAERRYLRRVLATTRLDRKPLAVKLGISERALYRKLAELKHRPGGRLGLT